MPYNIRMEDTRNTQQAAPVVDGGTGYEALFDGAALVEHPGRVVLRLTGKDPVGMLKAVLTNEIPAEAALGTYATLLNPKGRVQADLRVVKAPGSEDLLVDAGPEGAPAVREILGRYAPFSRVGLEDLPGWSALGLYGPHAADLLDGSGLAEHESSEVAVGGASLVAVGVTAPVPGFDLVGPTRELDAAREHLLGQGAIPTGADAYETARIAAGVPRFGPDITPENFPGECGILERAVSFKKGCYPGQETVARMHYRGQPNKMLHRLLVEGTPPEPGTEIIQNGKGVGKITSVATLPIDGETLALGYLARKTDLDAPLHAGDATVRPLALVGNDSR